mgnify:CR=1 FL=1
MLEAKTKLFKSGNSDAIRLNKALSKALKVQPGDELQLHYDPATQAVIIQRSDTQMTVSPEFKALLDETYQENKGAMDLLKDL